MKTFEFSGTLQASKSLMNRALIIQGHFPDIQILGSSDSRDVQFTQKALATSGSLIEVGEGGTTLRFLSFYFSRKPGSWTLRGSPRLMSRPIKGLIDLLSQLSVKAVQNSETTLSLESQGWVLPQVVSVDLSETSQFASGLLLNAWNLPQDLKLQLSKSRISDGYLDMTIELLRQAGMKLIVNSNNIVIPSGQKAVGQILNLEPDLSSAFVVASLAAIRGHSVIYNFPQKSLQPDFYFLELFTNMGIPWTLKENTLTVHRAERIEPIEVSLKNAPDLFPVLAILLSKTLGTSRLYGAPQLIYKESNRIQKISELLTKMQVKHQVLSDGMEITGSVHHLEFFEYDTDHDHRLAFAAALAKSMGYRMRIRNPEVVDKSFPGFWDLISGGPG